MKIKSQFICSFRLLIIESNGFYSSNCVTESITTKDSSKAILNPIRKLENANQNESICKVRFNIQGEKHDSISPKISPRKQESNQNIFKLVDDTINFIDQELTKSYKQTNIGMRGIIKATVNEADLIQKNDSICSIGKHHSFNSIICICSLIRHRFAQMIWYQD